MNRQSEAFSVDYPKKALLIVNPVSGKKLFLRHMPEVLRIFMDAGYLVTAAVTGRRGEATALAARYGGDYDLLCCAGGDGTLNETLTGLVRADRRVPLGYIPCGSTNDFAVSRALSADIPAQARSVASGKQRRYDVGRFGDQIFSYVAAFGAFSWLSYTTDQALKNVLGHTAYILDGIKDLSKIKSIHMKITADGAVHEGDYLFGAVCNSTSIAGTLELPKAAVDMLDGKFELLLVKTPKTLPDLDATLRGLFTQDYSCPFIDFFQASRIDIDNPPGLEWALDGEGSGLYGHVHIEPIPGFLTLQG